MKDVINHACASCGSIIYGKGSKNHSHGDSFFLENKLYFCMSCTKKLKLGEKNEN